MKTCSDTSSLDLIYTTFIVCDFEHKSTFTKIYKTLFRVYATPTQSERVSYALDIGANITDYFEKYFDVRK